ncbi:hypothetical protein HDU98_007788 [Podochytrium sp. JEL0797]|nr:hypothetical protein HDU98_007788 [Podochytrium sp. JEL0797]
MLSAITQSAPHWKPYRLPEAVIATHGDWVPTLELDGAKQLWYSSSQVDPSSLRVLVLYGSLRATSYSRLLAYEYARILDHLGCDVRVFDPRGLPIKDEVSENHEKVVELRALSEWSQGHIWVSPEQHSTLTAVFKNQIDWIPLSIGAVRPTQGRTLAVSQVNGGSQSFNTVSALRILGRWMRMVTLPNQSSIPKAWTEFDMLPGVEDELGLPVGRIRKSSFRERVVDVAEEFFKFSLLLRGNKAMLLDRFSEREEAREKGDEKEELKVDILSVM